MSKRHSNKQPASSVDLARRTPSKVAVAAFQRSGAGSHGRHGDAARRAERRQYGQKLRRGDWD